MRHEQIDSVDRLALRGPLSVTNGLARIADNGRNTLHAVAERPRRVTHVENDAYLMCLRNVTLVTRLWVTGAESACLGVTNCARVGD